MNSLGTVNREWSFAVPALHKQESQVNYWMEIQNKWTGGLAAESLWDRCRKLTWVLKDIKQKFMEENPLGDFAYNCDLSGQEITKPNCCRYITGE